MAKINTAVTRAAKTPMRTAAAEPSPKKSRKAARSESVRPLEAVIAGNCAVPPIEGPAAADNASTAEVADPSADNAADQGIVEQHMSAPSDSSAKPMLPSPARQQANPAVRAADAALIHVLTGSGKQARIIEMLRRPEGATNAQLMDVTGWQSHSVRGVLSGALKRKLGLPINSTVEPGRGRVYRIDAGTATGVGSLSDSPDPAAATTDVAAKGSASRAGTPGATG